MAVTLTVAELRTAARAGSSDLETAVLTRLLAVGTALAERHAPAAPPGVQNEAVILLAGYIHDAPNSPRGVSFADAFGNSGAAALLEPWRPVRARAVTADPVAEVL